MSQRYLKSTHPAHALQAKPPPATLAAGPAAGPVGQSSNTAEPNSVARGIYEYD